METLLSGAACGVLVAGVLVLISLGQRAQAGTERNKELTRLRAELTDAGPARQEVHA